MTRGLENVEVRPAGWQVGWSWIAGRFRARGTYRVARWLFPRLLAACYVAAFGSWLAQCDGLVGSEGILPAGRFLEQVKVWAAERGFSAFAEVPSLFLWHYSDEFAKEVCWIAAILCGAVMAGAAQGPLLLVLWFAYLSIVSTGGVFMNFQWDTLLLEAGLLGAIFAPWRPWAARVPARNPDGPWFAMFLLHWLLFRLMFFSGFVKLSTGDATWRNGTALAVHYESQPLPTWIGWWAHQLPQNVHIASCVIMFLIELALPAVMFFGRPGRVPACAGFCGLMLLIMASGNYTFFNWLTVFLALTLLDDACWPSTVRRWLAVPGEGPQPVGWTARSLAVAAGAPLFALSIIGCAIALGQRPTGGPGAVPEWAGKFYAAAAPFRSVNNYGLFRVMTTERNEIVIEVSADGQRWHELEFRWKPGDLTRRPGFVAPHQPRLDWQMWFAAFHPGFVPQRDMNNPQMNWFGHFLGALLAGKRPVWELLDDPPIPPGDVRFVRCQFYRYRFTGFEARRGGHWWTRELAGPYSEAFSSR